MTFWSSRVRDDGDECIIAVLNSVAEIFTFMVTSSRVKSFLIPLRENARLARTRVYHEEMYEEI